MPATETLYQMLGLTNTRASMEEISIAYKAMALQWHPDKVPIEQKEAATEMFKKIISAYEILKDPEARAKYDKSIMPSQFRTFRPASYTSNSTSSPRSEPLTSFYFFETRSAALSFQQALSSNDLAHIYVFKGSDSLALFSIWIRSYWIDKRKTLQMQNVPQQYLHAQTNDEASLIRVLKALKRDGNDLNEIEPKSTAPSLTRTNT